MKIVITGGHFSPAYSVIKDLHENDEVLVIGRKYAFEGDSNETLEYKLCNKESIPFISINTGRFQRKFTKHTLPSFARFPRGVYESVKILKREKPDVILTFGGYVGLSVSLAAKILNIPVVIHEQTLNSGLSAKIIANFAKVICISFESSRKHFKNKNVVLTGNPIRKEIFEYKKIITENDLPIIYITGGSTGSHAINKIVRKIVPDLLKSFSVFHQTGNNQEFNDFQNLKELQQNLDENLKKNYYLKEFFSPEEVGFLINNSKLVISRAGANTACELLAVGSVSLLIPLPHGQSNEQLENANLFRKTGLGDYIEQDDLTPEILLNKVFDMIKNRQEYTKNKSQAIKLVHKNASIKIIEQVYLYGGKRGEKREPEEQS